MKPETRNQKPEGLRFAAIVFLAAAASGFWFLPSGFGQAPNEDFNRAVYFGRKFFDLHDYAAAYDQFAKADALKPDNAGVLYDMALVLAKAGRFSEAQGKVDRYNQLFPNG